MMKPLRKRHLQVWIVLALLLPAGIVVAWLYAPGFEPVKLLNTGQLALLPAVAGSQQSNTYTVRIRTDQQGSAWQLEWQNRTPLTVPSAVIYRQLVGVKEITKNELVGRIEARGSYIFPLRIDPAAGNELKFLVYDFIHQRTIDSLKFKL